MIQYRKANLPDLPQLITMRWEFQIEFETDPVLENQESFRYSCEKFYVQMLRSDSWSFWIAEQDQEVIAHVAVLTVENIPTPQRLLNRWAYLTNTYTKKEFRGLGIASKLIHLAIEEAKLLDIETMIVWPSEESRNLYWQAGFKSGTTIMELEF